MEDSPSEYNARNRSSLVTSYSSCGGLRVAGSSYLNARYALTCLLTSCSAGPLGPLERANFFVAIFGGAGAAGARATAGRVSRLYGRGATAL